MTLQKILEKLIHEANLESLGFRRALRSAIVVFVSVLVYHVFSLTQGYWVTLTAMLVVQATVGATLRKSFQRFLGTLLGVIIASLLILWIHERFIIEILAIIFLFCTYFFNPYSSLINYGFVMIPVSILVVFLLSLTNPEKINAAVIYARFYDTAIGALLGILGSLFLFPNKVKGEFDISKHYLEKQLADYFFAIMNMFLKMPGAEIQSKAKKMQVETALLSGRQFYLERCYEMHFRFSQHEVEKQFLDISERMAQRLFSLHQRARYPLALEKFKKMQAILIRLQEQGVILLRENDASDNSLWAVLQEMQQYLADISKQQEHVVQDWQEDIAPFAGLHFVMTGLIQDIQQARNGQRYSV